MYILGIETSCDETAASVVKDGRSILSSMVSSSLFLHKRYGGVIPEIASRMQLEAISQVADVAVKEARLRLSDMDAVAVTAGPGLLGSLLIGLSFAKSLALSLKIPLLGVNHLHSHIYASFLEGLRMDFPFVALVVSGGHTNLFYVKDFSKIENLGQTLDDACGEAFDKVAKILGLGYPGGPAIEKWARTGNVRKINFRCSGTREEFDFSFSGIKTAVLYLTRNRRLSNREKKDIAASFQEAVIDALLKKSLLACRRKKANRLVIGGGVAANHRLRVKFVDAGRLQGLDCYFPRPALCTDNASMVAGLAYPLFKKGFRDRLDLTAQVDLM
ncbi:MAG: tRNA (adenosine(37)-N6)-threonylcarbamoyltransferase complex transferase subunit TsaD [Candidatus Omnitrophota bacterium]